QLQDPKYNLFVPVRAFGQFGIQVIDARKFIVKLVGTVSVFDRETLSRYFKGVLLTKIKDQIASYLVHKKISILDISAYLDDISIHLNESLNPAFETYGIRLVNFFVTSINIPEDDPGVRKLKDALAKRAEMDIFGYSYQQERTFDTLQSAAANEGAASGGLMGAGIGLSMGLGVGGVVGSMFGEQVQNLSTNPNMNPNKISEKIKCNSCGTECDANMVFCYSCGSKLLKPSSEVKKSCSTCHADILGTMKFCPHCGAKQLKICDSCGFELHGEMKFCPNCGKSCN
ncbi:MAG: SPFH domain-containing protein, partial [Vallitaleaceae bacterium]|nr:SPFH domain-containing protein [Vallitaleaceae bacterium]